MAESRARAMCERLLVSGAEVFAVNWFGGGSLSEFCERGGSSSNVIHHHDFGVKAGLPDAAIGRYGNSGSSRLHWH